MAIERRNNNEYNFGSMAHVDALLNMPFTKQGPQAGGAGGASGTGNNLTEEQKDTIRTEIFTTLDEIETLEAEGNAGRENANRADPRFGNNSGEQHTATAKLLRKAELKNYVNFLQGVLKEGLGSNLNPEEQEEKLKEVMKLAKEAYELRANGRVGHDAANNASGSDNFNGHNEATKQLAESNAKMNKLKEMIETMRA